MHKLLASLSITALLLASFPTALSAADTGTITIEQVPINGVLGEWILIKPGNKRVSLRKEFYTLERAPLGNYTLLIEPPVGSSTTIRKYLDTDLLETIEVQQTAFTLEQNMNIRLHIEYEFSRVGIVSVNSSPPGLEFTLSGPNDMVYDGKTPDSLENAPEGLYSVQYHELEGCASPRPLSDRLEKDGRINFSITIECEGLEDMVETQEYQRAIESVSTVIDGETVVFHDVPISQWFAPYVHTALKTGIMSGYRDGDGKPTGEYGPGDQITIAQLAKIAHELATIDETKVRVEPINTRARNQWFAQYYASAEQADWLAFADRRTDPGRPATRAEVIATLLQALEVPRLWPTGLLFTDVKRTTDYAASIETAATDDIIAGFTDASGRVTGRFGPEQPINRAEMAKIISRVIEVYLEG